MPSGIVNSAATLKRAMRTLLKGMKNVHTRTWEEHLKILRELFTRLAQAGMTIRPSKCIFGVSSIDFPGGWVYLVSMRIMSPKSEKLQDQQQRSRFVPLWDWQDITEISSQILQLSQLPLVG